MSGAYFFNEHLRWTFLWENPNCWAAFLACVLAWVWCGQAQASLRLEFKFKLHALGAIALYIAEVGIWFLLVKTYSRGGLVAAVVAMVFFFGLRGTGCQPVSSMGILSMRFVWHGRLARVFGNIAVRIALIATLCMAVGFASRMSPEYIAHDKSVLNRVDQWKAALVMISDSPFSGWGHNLSGMMYQNWYQPLEHTTRPIGFVNSFLEIAVEQGSHVLFLVIVCASALLLIAAKFRRVGWVAAAGACLMAWLVSNSWSSIWLWPGLWILPGVAMLCIIIAEIFSKQISPKEALYESASGLTKAQKAAATEGTESSHVYESASGLTLHELARITKAFHADALIRVNPCNSWLKWVGNFCVSCAFLRLMIVSLFVGIVAWAGIIGAGLMLAKDFPFQAKPVARGDAAIVSRRGASAKSSKSHTELWVDAAVTGRYWGKAIRTILENKDCGSLIVYAPWALRTNRLERPVNRYVYTGFQAELISTKVSGTVPVIILHPAVYPPATQTHGQVARATLQSHGLESHAATITVCLPAFDASLYNLPWRRWAAENGAKLIFSPQDGTRINPNQNREFWRSLLFDE